MPHVRARECAHIGAEFNRRQARHELDLGQSINA